MKRRSRAGGKRVKTRRHKAVALKRSNTSKAMRRVSSASTGDETEISRLRRQLSEALEQQTATADVLKIISRSTFDLQTVLDSLIETQARLCGAHRAVIFRRDGDSYHGVAFYNTSPELVDFIRRHPITPGRQSISARALLERRTVHVADVQADAEYKYALSDGDPIRTILGVPMFRGNDLVGSVTLYKLELQPFTDKQIEMVTTFADQAVIAMENTRLMTETREALERQTATAEVLQVINSSPGNLAPVFDAILEKAHGLCAVTHGTLQLYDGVKFHAGAVRGLPEALADRLRQGFIPGANSPIQRLLDGARFAHVPDVGEVDDPTARVAAELSGIRTTLFIALRKDDRLLGYITAARREVRLFTGKEIALLESFAAQAVLAMENARLLDELRARNGELAETLEFQTATGEVLRSVASSPDNLQSVFEAMLEKMLWGRRRDSAVKSSLRSTPIDGAPLC